MTPLLSDFKTGLNAWTCNGFQLEQKTPNWKERFAGLQRPKCSSQSGISLLHDDER